MNALTQFYGPSEGPLGFPMPSKSAFALESILKSLPKDNAFTYRKAVQEKGTTEKSDRSDVSWISTEDVDRQGDVVVARGMNDAHFKQNPIVTLNHAYHQPPVGKSLWRKHVKEGEINGIKAKTAYPSRPGDWPEGQDWPADLAYSLVQADLLRGKSIGFLPLKVHTPETKEIKNNPGWEKVSLVIDEWLLLEYACVFLPAQQNAVLETVGKSLPALPEDFQKALGINIKALLPTVKDPMLPDAQAFTFTSLDEIENAVANRIKQLDPAAIAARAVETQIDLMKGRV